MKSQGIMRIGVWFSGIVCRFMLRGWVLLWRRMWFRGKLKSGLNSVSFVMVYVVDVSVIVNVGVYVVEFRACSYDHYCLFDWDLGLTKQTGT